MKTYAEEDRVGVCRKLRTEGLYKKKFAGGYPYISEDSGSVVRSTRGRPIYSWGKNYNKFDEDFALFVWTLESSHEAIEERLDKAYEEVSEEDAKACAEVDDFFYLQA